MIMIVQEIVGDVELQLCSYLFQSILMDARVIRAFSSAFAPPLPLTSATTTTATTRKTVKIPARLRRMMELALVLEFKLSSVRLSVVVLKIIYVVSLCHCQVTSSLFVIVESYVSYL